MKTIFKMTFSLLIAFILLSCQEKQTEKESIRLTALDEYTVVESDGIHAQATILPTGSSTAISVESSAPWTLVSEEDNKWYSAVVEGDKILLSADEIVSDDERSSLLRVRVSERVWGYIMISQRGLEAASISADKDSVAFREWGGSMEVTINSNKTWRVANAEEIGWLKVSTEEEKMTVSAEANQEEKRLSAELMIVAGEGINCDTLMFPVSQSPWSQAYVVLPQPEIALPDVAGAVTLTVSSNRPLTAVSSEEWLKVSVEKDSILVLEALPGTSGATAQISLSTPDETPVTAQIDITRFSDPMIMEYTFDSSVLTKVSVPMGSPANLYIDWGDGKSDLMYAAGNGAFTRPEHEYDEDRVYTVKVYGTVGAIMTGGNGWEYLTDLVSWGNLGFTSFNYGFQSAGIKSLPDNTGEVFKNVKSFNYAFKDCQKLEKLPSSMFCDTKAAQLQSTFWNCTSLKEIPSDLFEGASKIETITGIFMGCTSLEEIPEGLLDPLVNLNRCVNLFAECSSLRVIPASLFAKNTALTTLTGAFRNTAVTEIPAGLFDNNPLLSDIFQCFWQCQKLESIPVSLFDNTKKLRNINGLFEGCSSLKGSTPYTIVEGKEVHLWERVDHTDLFTAIWNAPKCFTGCTMLEDWDMIPENWKN